MPAPPSRNELAPDDRRFSAVKFDEWKAPTDPDFYYKVAEFDDSDALPVTSIGRGESLVIYNTDGNTVASWEGPDHPTASKIPDI
ncbi:hypothetical protein [Halorubrum sp. GN12_10-3_MGM]|uniref:hypothetical protein n=1 Tax=Halorubrum sp. GN12_10-3_MGM TaxID=2518113 RepID=UPI0010F8424E|nr:hypothetical protein [Halorubrum sp. GN12_10-3_MGM]TKX64361.1 hypothetical protein EXE47_11640 [Halorubrum sp. GN12_10-3_MGM]